MKAIFRPIWKLRRIEAYTHRSLVGEQKLLVQSPPAGLESPHLLSTASRYWSAELSSLENERIVRILLMTGGGKGEPINKTSS